MIGLDPDLEGEIKLQTSSLRLTEKRLCEMVEKDIYNHPEPQMNLKLSLSISQATYNQLVLDDCPEDRLQLVRMWIEEIATMMSGPDPRIQLLQQAFEEPAAAAAQPQAGLQPAAQSQQPMMAPQ